MVSGIGPSQIVALDARLMGGQSTGDSTYWDGLLYGLQRLSSEFRFLLISNARRPAGIPAGDRFSWVYVPGRSQRWWSLVTLPLKARRLGASLLHVQYSLSPLARGGITTVHDISFMIGPEWFPAKHRLVLSKTVPSSIDRAQRVITVSQTSRAEIEERIPAARGKTRVTPLAAHPQIHPVDRDVAKKTVRGRFGLDGPYMLTVGTRWPRKNMALAVDAVNLLEGFPHRLAITGKPGWGEERLGARSLATGYVDYDELSALYSAADLYLAPSRHEGFGIPVIEAFSCGCPVLSSAGGALPETVGDAGYVERSWAPEDWAATIGRLLSDSSKLDDLRARGLQRADEFTWEETARKTLEVYREATMPLPLLLSQS